MKQPATTTHGGGGITGVAILQPPALSLFRYGHRAPLPAVQQQQRQGSTVMSADRRHSPISDERRDQWRQPAPTRTTGTTAETRLPASGDKTSCDDELGGPAAKTTSSDGDKDEALF
nr:hypothetical protein Itr_chr07CG09650 [Ipomoea trifida]